MTGTEKSQQDSRKQQLGWKSLEQDRRSEIWDNWPGAVLLDNEIRQYCNDPEFKLIDPFDERNIKPARYQLTLGNKVRLGGKDITIGEETPLVIPAHQVAIVQSYEKLNIPRFLIGRWNLRVDLVYKGLLWVGALQVDPGWVGYLPCPIYNLSDQPVELIYRERTFSIDFVRTTRFSDANLRYPHPMREDIRAPNPPLGAYDPERLRSGPYETLKDLESLTEFRNFAFVMLAVGFTALAALTAALGVVAIGPVVSAEDSARLLEPWPLTAVSLSVFATILAILSVGVQVVPRLMRYLSGRR